MIMIVSDDVHVIMHDGIHRWLYSFVFRDVSVVGYDVVHVIVFGGGIDVRDDCSVDLRVVDLVEWKWWCYCWWWQHRWLAVKMSES